MRSKQNKMKESKGISWAINLINGPDQIKVKALQAVRCDLKAKKMRVRANYHEHARVRTGRDIKSLSLHIFNHSQFLFSLSVSNSLKFSLKSSSPARRKEKWAAAGHSRWWRRLQLILFFLFFLALSILSLLLYPLFNLTFTKSHLRGLDLPKKTKHCKYLPGSTTLLFPLLFFTSPTPPFPFLLPRSLIYDLKLLVLRWLLFCSGC